MALAVPLSAQAGVATADFLEELDLFEGEPDVRVLQALDVPILGGPELTEKDEIANPEGWGDSLVVDLDLKTDQLSLSPTSGNCYGYITVTVDDWTGFSIEGLHLIEQTAFYFQDEGGGPKFATSANDDAGAARRGGPGPDEDPIPVERTATLTHDALVIDYRITSAGGDCDLQLIDEGTDRYQLNPAPGPRPMGSVQADFRQRLNLTGFGPAQDRILERLDVTVGEGSELEETDETQNPQKWGGNLDVDLDPASGVLTLTANGNVCYGYVTLDIENIDLGGDEIAGISLVSSGAFSNDSDPDFRRTLAFTNHSLTVDYHFDEGPIFADDQEAARENRGGKGKGGCPLLFANGGSDVYQLATIVPEPGAALGTITAIATLFGLRARRRG